ncbi:MAG: ABC transporter permease [Deltaproteobacteria bacterium]|nr:ABC transporter permease [Deltaproteobacteria bacterium]
MLLQDLRFASRSLLKRPGYSALILTTLALGIGATTAVYSVAHAVLLQPLPWDEPQRIVHLLGLEHGELDDRPTIAYLDFDDWRRESASFEVAAAFDEWAPNLTGEGEPERLEAAQVNIEFFDVLGVQPSYGRFFSPQEDVDGQDRVVVLTHGLFQRRFAGDPAVLGRSIQLNGTPHTVVGVGPKDWVDPMLSGVGDAPPQLWRPLGYGGVEAERLPNRGSTSFTAIARLRAGTTLPQAQAELDLLAADLEVEYSATNEGRGVHLVPLRESLVGNLRSSLWILLGAALLVLAIACSNVASLMLGRAMERRQETALRQAMGASRGQIARLLLVESFLLATLGGVLGIGLGYFARDVLVAFSGNSLPFAQEVGLDLRVAAFACLITLATGLVCGIAPVLKNGGSKLETPLRLSPYDSPPGRFRPGLRGLLIISEVALSLLLLSGAGLMLESLWNLLRVDAGISADHVLTFGLAPTDREPEKVTAFYQSLLDRLGGLPGVEAAGAIDILPLSGSFNGNTVHAEGQPLPPPSREFSAETRVVTPGYFAASGMTLLRGRLLSPQDRPGSPPVTVVNQALAEHFWPRGNPIGKRLLINDISCEVVGQVADVKHLSLRGDSPSQVYLARDQGVYSWLGRRMSVALRTSTDPMELIPLVRREVRALDENLPLSQVRTLEEILSSSLAQPRLHGWLLGCFAGLALVLAALGLYAVLAYSVVQRRREIAIRMAIGAGRGKVLAEVLGQGLTLVAAGIAVGLAAAFGTNRLLQSLLFGVSASDLGTYLWVPVVLFVVALVACYLPARRAAATDPLDSLKV